MKSRVDRFKSIKSEFLNLGSFQLEIVRAIEHPYGACGLWKTIYNIIDDSDKRGDEFVLICEDDHIFTNSFGVDQFKSTIQECESMGVDVLLGGVSWSRVLPTGTQVMVLPFTTRGIVYGSSGISMRSKLGPRGVLPWNSRSEYPMFFLFFVRRILIF